LFTNFREILFIAFEFRLAVPSTFVTVRAEKPGADRNSTHKTKKIFTPKRLNNQKSRTQLSSVDVVKPDTKTQERTLPSRLVKRTPLPGSHHPARTTANYPGHKRSFRSPPDGTSKPNFSLRPRAFIKTQTANISWKV
jgi:hypothetical protein